MLFQRSSPAGIEVPIQKLQSFLYGALPWKNIDAYGRVYRDKTESGYMPKWFEGGKYNEIVFDADNKAALFFFDVQDSITHNASTAKATVDIIFQVNLSKTGSGERNDEEVRMQAIMLLTQNRFDFVLKGWKTGYKEVFSRFDALATKDEVTWGDVHPLHVFKLTFEIAYSV